MKGFFFILSIVLWFSGITADLYREKFSGPIVDGGVIDERLNNLAQDDPMLIKAIRERFLVWPSIEDYPRQGLYWKRYLPGTKFAKLFN